METIEELKKKMSKAQKILDILLKMLGIQTQIERLQLELMIRVIAKEEGVDENLLLAVIMCESNLNPKAKNKNKDGTYDYGICQYNSYWYIQKGLISYEDAMNPEKAVRLMARRFKQGWAKDWVCYSTKKYIGFL